MGDVEMQKRSLVHRGKIIKRKRVKVIKVSSAVEQKSSITINGKTYKVNAHTKMYHTANPLRGKVIDNAITYKTKIIGQVVETEQTVRVPKKGNVYKVHNSKTVVVTSENYVVCVIKPPRPPRNKGIKGPKKNTGVFSAARPGPLNSIRKKK